MRPCGAYPLWQIQAVGDSFLRYEDERELKSLTGVDPGLALVESVLASEKSWVCYARATQRIVGVFGYANNSALPGRCIWMVGTAELAKYPKEFLSVSAQIIDHWLNTFGTLYNLIDLRNITHIDWLSRLGFSLPPDKQVTMQDGIPFQYFIKEK
jgi:hypothetical protein